MVNFVDIFTKSELDNWPNCFSSFTPFTSVPSSGKDNSKQFQCNNMSSFIT